VVPVRVRTILSFATTRAGESVHDASSQRRAGWPGVDGHSECACANDVEARQADPCRCAVRAGGIGRPGDPHLWQRLTPVLGQQVIIENKPGASGGVGAAIVANSPADGYTLLLSPTAVMAITPTVRQVNYDINAFAAVSRLSTPLLLVSLTNALDVKDWQAF